MTTPDKAEQLFASLDGKLPRGLLEDARQVHEQTGQQMLALARAIKGLPDEQMQATAISAATGTFMEMLPMAMRKRVVENIILGMLT